MSLLHCTEDWSLVIGDSSVGMCFYSTNTFTGSIAVITLLFCINNQCSLASSL